MLFDEGDGTTGRRGMGEGRREWGTRNSAPRGYPGTGNSGQALRPVRLSSRQARVARSGQAGEIRIRIKIRSESGEKRRGLQPPKSLLCLRQIDRDILTS